VFHQSHNRKRDKASDSSPDIIERIESYLDTASSESRPPGKRPLEINQVLVNEYQADQGISVSRVSQF
jgi:hypothetical protein